MSKASAALARRLAMLSTRITTAGDSAPCSKTAYSESW